METPSALSSPSASLSSKGTDDLERLRPMAGMGKTPPQTGSAGNTPAPLDDLANESFVVTNGDSEDIIVDAPAPNPEDSLMLDPEEDEYEEEEDDFVVSPQKKRKRSSVNYILGDYTAGKTQHSPQGEPRAKRRILPQVRGLIIGVWRDSDEPDDEDKHVVFGFIDVNERLRTRIYAQNRREQELIGNVPTGAGGCWVTFERIIFEPYLRGLSPVQVKEYVKLRTGAPKEHDPEVRKAAELAAVQEAKRIASEIINTTPEPKLAMNRRSIGRSSLARESLGASGQRSSGFQAVNSPSTQPPPVKASAENKMLGVPLGYWGRSDEIELADKHAVFGVVSESDCFRVKVQKVTRDGRVVIGNFPVGAGAMWIKYDELVFEPHLEGLTRPEVKEYCRIRQRDLIAGETEKSRRGNETKAIREAKQIVLDHLNEPSGTNVTNVKSRRPSPEPEVRHSARSESKALARQQAQSEAAIELARKEKARAMAERDDLARKEVALTEAKQLKAFARKELKENMDNLNVVWKVQNHATMNGTSSPARSVQDVNGSTGNFGGLPAPAAELEVKSHNGIRYERKTTGPLAGKLVGPGQLITINGEDYVEYRVLSKPSFD